MAELLKPVEGVTVDMDRFFQIVRAERNLAPAFGQDQPSHGMPKATRKNSVVGFLRWLGMLGNL